jgi:hypothetical protein
MYPIGHQTRVTSVSLGKTILAQTTELSTWSEVLAQVWVNPITFKIQRAHWEILRSDGRLSTSTGDVPSLTGIEAYFGCGKPFRRALAAYPPAAVELFLENASALIQAETFIYKERGHASLGAYVDYWKEFYRGSCRYYSHLEAVKRSWGDYVSIRQPSTNLFNRFKTFALDRCADGLVLRACMSDSFHELSCTLRLDSSGENINEAAGAIIRAPDQVCPEAATFVDRLTDRRLSTIGREEVSVLLGRGQGCVHLIELVNEAVSFALVTLERTVKR